MYRRTEASPGSPASSSPVPPTTAWMSVSLAAWRPPSAIPTWSSSATRTPSARLTAAGHSSGSTTGTTITTARPTGSTRNQRDSVRSRPRPGEAVPQHGRRHLPVDQRRPRRGEHHGDRPAERAVLQHLEQRLQPGPLPRRLAGPGPSAFGPRQGRRGPEQRAIGSAAPALYAATETGPFVLDGSTWRSLLGGGAPAGRYLSVEGVPSAKLVRFGTYSRGVWDYVPPPRR